MPVLCVTWEQFMLCSTGWEMTVLRKRKKHLNVNNAGVQMDVKRNQNKQTKKALLSLKVI